MLQLLRSNPTIGNQQRIVQSVRDMAMPSSGDPALDGHEEPTLSTSRDPCSHPATSNFAKNRFELSVMQSKREGQGRRETPHFVVEKW